MRLGIVVPGILLALVLGNQIASAQEVNCANDFRSGKLYFAEAQKSQQAKKSDTVDLYQKARARFQLAVETCPDKYDYHARYAMTLGQLAGVYLEDVMLTLLPEDQPAMVDSILTMYAMAGVEFDLAYDADDSKSSRKFVRENRDYYWVARYNAAIKRLKEEPPDYEGAALEFQLALLVDPRNLLEDSKTKAPRNAKVYNQGAIAFINNDQQDKAAEWVQMGLELSPNDKKLNELLEMIYVDAGDDFVERAEMEKDPALAMKGAEFLTEVLERRGGEDANVLFSLGLAKLTISSLLADTDSVQARAEGTQGAEIFGKAAEIATPEGDNLDFYLAAKFNQIQCYLNAEEYEMALAACREYLALDCDDWRAWRITAQTYSLQDDSKQAVAALMASKSIQGNEIQVADAKTNAQGEEAAAYGELGDPTLVFSYQDSEGNQVNTAIWCEASEIRNFILGDQVGRLTWK
jgi:tetratricopeptide (TPR) repeat protein